MLADAVAIIGTMVCIYLDTTDCAIDVIWYDSGSCVWVRSCILVLLGYAHNSTGKSIDEDKVM